MLSQGIIQPDTTPLTTLAMIVRYYPIRHCTTYHTRYYTSCTCSVDPRKFDSSHYNETDLFQKIGNHGKIKNLYLIFSAFELGFGDAVADLDLAKIDKYYKDNVTSLGKKSFRCW